MFYQGVYPPYADGKGLCVNAIDRSNSQKLAAYVDDFGVVKLFNYPCVDVTVSCKTKN